MSLSYRTLQDIDVVSSVLVGVSEGIFQCSDFFYETVERPLRGGQTWKGKISQNVNVKMSTKYIFICAFHRLSLWSVEEC